MSPTSKSKSKDKKVGKEAQKSSPKPSGQVNAVGIPASGYNPLSGTFHALETAPGTSAPISYGNGRFRNIDDTDEHCGNSFGTGADCDSVSNNGSWSGESEEHKEKNLQSSSRQDAVPGADNDKREKIRQKNEKKHQRQKERRAQELREKCSGYLMSRKLEVLAQQLVAMGFPSERATMALILNEGKVEESVAWLFEGNEDSEKDREHNLDGGGNLKIDISEELAQITDMELKYKCSRQDVERIVVTCEGDLEKAEETLKTQKQDPPVPPKPEETGDPPTASNDKLPGPVGHNLSKIQPKLSTSTAMQQRGDEKDFNYTKAGPVGIDTGNRSGQALKRIQPKLEWTRSQQLLVPVEKKWPGVGSSPIAYSVASSPSGNLEAQYVAAGSELKNLQLGSVREPVILMQRPQSAKIKQPTSSNNLSPPGTASGRFINAEVMKSNGFMPHISSSRSMSPNHADIHHLHIQHQYLQQQFVSNDGSLDPLGTSRMMNGMWSRPGTSPTIAAASSLGLFSGFGSPGSSSVDWKADSSTLQFDYTNIDWSLNGGSSASRQACMWQGMHTFPQNNSQMTDPINPAWHYRTATRPVVPNENGGVPFVGLQHGVVPTETPSGGSAGTSRDWSSPFEEKDIFSLSRHYVSSPSL